MTRVCLLLLLSALSSGSCALTKPEVTWDKPSPNGSYRVKIRLWEEIGKGAAGKDHLRIQYLKGDELIGIYETEDEDQYESSLRQSVEVVEWVGENVFRRGRTTAGQPFSDQLVVSNNSNEYLKHFEVAYGKYESFYVFDLSPGSQLALYASPDFRPDGSSNYFLGYGGQTLDGKTFEGALEAKPRRSKADGPLQFNININQKDLHGP